MWTQGENLFSFPEKRFANAGDLSKTFDDVLMFGDVNQEEGEKKAAKSISMLLPRVFFRYKIDWLNEFGWYMKEKLLGLGVIV